MPTAANVIAGPGKLYVAALGTTEPADATTALAAAFKEIGYTEDGNEFSYEVTREDVYVAETITPIRSYSTKVSAKIKFVMAEASSNNLAIALNKFSATHVATAAIEPPSSATEVRVMMVLDTDAGARWIFRKAVSVGSVMVPHKKAPNKTAISVEFTLEDPGAGAALFKVIPNASGLV